MGKQGCTFFGTQIPYSNIAQFILECINAGSNCVLEIALRGIITYPSRRVVCYPKRVPACGIDIHKDFFVAAIVNRDGSTRIERFDHTQDGLLSFKSWVLAAQCPVIAMESTGNYWRPLYITLEGSYRVHSRKCICNQTNSWTKNRYHRCTMDCRTGIEWTSYSVPRVSERSQRNTRTDTGERKTSESTHSVQRYGA